MANSIQVANGKHAIINDADLLVLVRMFLSSEAQRGSRDLAPVVDAWEDALSVSGPGTIDLEMQRWSDDEGVRETLAARLMEVESDLHSLGGTLSLAYLERLGKVPGVTFGKPYPTRFLLEASEQLRNLLDSD